MSLNTRSSGSVTYSKTRSSIIARRSAEQTNALLKSPRKSVISSTKKTPQKSDKKSYSLRNAKPNANSKADGNSQQTPGLSSLKGKVQTIKKVSPIKDVIVLSDNSNDSSEVDFKPQSAKIGVSSVTATDVVIVSSDDEDDVNIKNAGRSNVAKDVCKVSATADSVSSKETDENRNKQLRNNKSEVVRLVSKTVNQSDLTKLTDAIQNASSMHDNPTHCASPKTNITECLGEKTEENITDLLKDARVVLSATSQLVTSSKTKNEEELISSVTETVCQNKEVKSPPHETCVRNLASSLNLNEPTSDLMSEKPAQSESFELYEHGNDDASPISPNASERPVSSNSRSTTSTSSIILQDHDLYSPASTDLSMSEDSRGSFVESGSEKAITRRPRGRAKTRSTGKSSAQTKCYSENVSSSCSPSEDGSVEPPSKRNKRLPCRVGITWEIGQRLEAVDHNECRYPAKIVEVDRDACEVLIHFEGWSARFDEWVTMDSPKLRPMSSPNVKTEAKERKSTNQQYKAKEKILARWNDGKLYEATVSEPFSEGYYVVIFYDGFIKKLPVSAMRKLNDPTVRKRRLQLQNSPQKSSLGRPPSQARVHKEQNADSGSASGRRSATSVEPPTPHRRNPHGTVASKQFVVESDHNQFKCTFEGCSKEFRKECLLQSHLKHYHNCDKGSSDVSGRSSPVCPRKVKARVKSLVLPPEPDKPKNFSPDVEEGKLFMSIKCEPELPIAEDDSEKFEPKATVDTIASSVIESKEQISMSTTITSPQLPLQTAPTTNLLAEALSGETSVKSIEPEQSIKPTVEVKNEAVPAKIVKPSPRKEIYPVTKMETRHAKPCLFRDDSIYTGYISYRSLYTKGSRGGRKSVDVELKRGRPCKTEEDKTFPETKKRRRRLSHKTDTIKRKSDCPDIDDEIAEIKRRRVDRVSESSVKTDDTTWDSVDYDENEDDDETVSDHHEPNSDELVRCICGNEEENGLMFQCEECKTWQHAACFNIENEEDVPDTYFCYVCAKPKSQTGEGRNSEEDPWFTTGVMSTFNFLNEKSSSPINRPNSILASHELINSTNKVLSILKGLQHKIQIAGSDNHPDLRNWSKPWKQQGIPNKIPLKKPELVMSPAVQTPSQSTADAGDFLVFDHAYFSQSDSAIGLQEEVVTEQPETPANTIDLALSVNANVPVPEVKQRRASQVIQETREKPPARRRGSGREGGRGRGRGNWRYMHLHAPPVEEIIDVGTCKNNLISHIHIVQDNMDQELDLIENQLTLLEAEMDTAGFTGHSDIAPVLKTLKSLSKDLDVVQRFTLL